MNFSDGALEYDTGHSDEDCGQRIVLFPERIGPKVRIWYVEKPQLAECFL